MTVEKEPPGKSIGKTMVIMAWIIILAFLTWIFGNLEQRETNPTQEVTSVIENDSVSVTLERNRFGHYFTNAEINGEKISVLLDTGATNISIPLSLANKLQLERGAAYQVETANGTIWVNGTRLDSVAIGDIVLYDVRANINPGLNEVLLGMSFLKQLEITQRGNQLTLKQYK